MNSIATDHTNSSIHAVGKKNNHHQYHALMCDQTNDRAQNKYVKPLSGVG